MRSAALCGRFPSFMPFPIPCTALCLPIPVHGLDLPPLLPRFAAQSQLFAAKSVSIWRQIAPVHTRRLRRSRTTSPPFTHDSYAVPTACASVFGAFIILTILSEKPWKPSRRSPAARMECGQGTAFNLGRDVCGFAADGRSARRRCGMLRVLLVRWMSNRCSRRASWRARSRGWQAAGPGSGMVVWPTISGRSAPTNRRQPSRALFKTLATLREKPREPSGKVSQTFRNRS